MELERQVFAAVRKTGKLHPFVKATLTTYCDNITDKRDFNSVELQESCALIWEIQSGALRNDYEAKHYHVIAVFLAAWNNNVDILTKLLDETIYSKSILHRYRRIAFAYQGFFIPDAELVTLTLTELEILADAAGAGENKDLIDKLYGLNPCTLNFTIQGAKEWQNHKLCKNLKLRAGSSGKIVHSPNSCRISYPYCKQDKFPLLPFSVITFAVMILIRLSNL